VQCRVLLYYKIGGHYKTDYSYLVIINKRRKRKPQELAVMVLLLYRQQLACMVLLLRIGMISKQVYKFFGGGAKQE